MTAIFALPLSLFLGIMAALYRNSLYDRIVNSTTLTTIATPDFFVAYLLMFFFAIKYKWFYTLSTVGETTPFLEHAYRAVLPPRRDADPLIVAHMMRMTRAALINLLSSPYMEMARLKGVSARDAILKHALPNAWAPIATVIAFNLAYLVVGVVIVEVVYVYPASGS